jgi:hypothetical protein
VSRDPLEGIDADGLDAGDLDLGGAAGTPGD